MSNPGSQDATEPRPIPQEAFDWYDEYAHGLIDRRTFLDRLSTLSAAGFTMGMLLPALTPDYSLAEQVSFNDPDIKAQYATFASPKGHGAGRGYLVTPTKLEGKGPSVLVIHENRGLNPYIKDVARRLAKLVLLPLRQMRCIPWVGIPAMMMKAGQCSDRWIGAKIEQDFIAAAGFLKSHETSDGKLGAVGFCFGGYIVNMLAATMGDQLNAGVPFYGTPAAKELRKNITAPLLIQLAELDRRVNSTWEEYEEDLEANNVEFTMHMYPKANHGFHNDSTGRYDEEMAELAWKRTIEFFNKHLQ